MHEVLDIIVVGAGFGGMYMIHRARELGFSVQGIEAADGVGGTWYWNRYPGARCDIESFSYSYSFSDELQQEWVWPERYAAQPDILRYANHVADRFDLRRSILFGARVTSARFDAEGNYWRINTDRGRSFLAPFLVLATGCLSVPKVADLPGIDQFPRVFHTAKWPQHGVDFANLRVGLIGTGSSGIQSTPVIAAEAKHLTVFQRTPNFSIPSWNTLLDAERVRHIKAIYPELRRKSRNSCAGDYANEYHTSILDLSPAEREQAFAKRWLEGGFNFQYAFRDLLESEKANELAAEFVRRKIRERVEDPRTAEALCPKDHPIGAKRLCVDTGYYETFNRPNVTLVDLSQTPIETVTKTGIRTKDGFHELDAIVLATGFDAMTGAITRIDIEGRGGRRLAAEWANGPRTYLGVAVSGFPNLFIVTGPGSPSVLANMVLACEQHVEWISTCLATMRKRGLTCIEATPEAQGSWARGVNESAAKTLYVKCNSWYLGSNVPGKPRLFMPYVEGFKNYEAVCDRVAENGYAGFDLSTPRRPAAPLHAEALRASR
jgi:cyclohexanone monooxygenase